MSSNRSLLYELVAAWNVADRLGVERGDSLLSPVPLIPNEQVILYLHGGAYIKGSPSSHRKLVGRVSGNTGLRAFALDYRLAPGNPFPAQLHDAYIAFHYLVMQGFKKEDIVLMGDSAGGHLCLTLFVLLRHTGLHPVRGMVLLSPLPGIHLRGQSLQTNAAYDYLCPLLLDIPTSSQRLLYKPGHMLTDEYLHEVGDPLLTPANGSLAQLPPTLIQSGSKEVLVDDIRELCDKARSENQEARVVYEEYEDMVHVFQRFEFREESKRAYEAIGDFVRSL
ncbi:alpha/beta-hydrolase [Martensiomyces pterosporus]|nr:alpha/beta-hydrolase [Martensiomyces pterosporus]